MDSLVVILVLVVLAILIGSILGFVAYGRTTELRRELAFLRAEIRQLSAARSAAAAEGPDERRAVLPDTAPSAAPTGSPVEPPPVQAEADEDASAGLTAGPPSPPVATPAQPGRRRDLEEAIGTRWAVWVGGLALALGAVFLVRYSIEAGLLGPGARIAAGLLFAVALLGAGEWLRRSGLAEPDSEETRRAYVPGVLVAAGIVAAFATTYAAYALYGFLPGVAAFLALGAIALGSLALALLHGPAIAGLGLAGSYATPLLVSSSEPALGSLSVYLLVVTAATLAVARLKRWRWLAVTAVVGAVAWAIVMTGLSDWFGRDATLVGGYIAAIFLMALYVFVASIHPRDPGRLNPHDRTAVVTLALFVLPVTVHLGWNGTTTAGTALLVLVALGYVAAAWLWPAARLLAGAAVAVVLIGYANFNVAYVSLFEVSPMGEPVRPDLSRLLADAVTGRMLTTGALLGLLFGAVGFAGALRSAGRAPLAFAGSAIPLGLVVVTWLRTGDYAVNHTYGAIALGLAVFFAAATESLVRMLRPRDPGADGATAVYAVATIAAVGTGMALMLEKGVLTIALALLVPAIAWVETVRPVRGLRLAAAAVALTVAARFVWDPAVVGGELGSTPVFNWLLYGYGVPAAAFGFAAWRFGRTRMDRWVPVFEALAVIFTVLTAVLLIHHGMNGGRLTGTISGVAEHALLVSAMLAVSLGMQWLGIRRASPVFAQGTLVVGGLGLAAAAAGLVVAYNPVLTGEPIDGGAADGDLLLGYLLPSVLAFGVAALASRRTDVPASWYARAAAWLGGVLGAIWVTLAVRAAWHTGDLSAGDVAETELYAYSAVWLACGLAILGIGVATGSRAVRMVSAAIVMAVVAKVFLVDTSGLTGGLRALSFIGLGAVLVAVGLAYQRILRRRPAAGAPPA